jgi:hypothetical protein
MWFWPNLRIFQLVTSEKGRPEQHAYTMLMADLASLKNGAKGIRWGHTWWAHPLLGHPHLQQSFRRLWRPPDTVGVSTEIKQQHRENKQQHSTSFCRLQRPPDTVGMSTEIKQQKTAHHFAVCDGHLTQWAWIQRINSKNTSPRPPDTVDVSTYNKQQNTAPQPPYTVGVSRESKQRSTARQLTQLE